MKYTIKEFNKDFTGGDDCLSFIFNKRYGRGYTCPGCGKSGFYRVRGRKCYACEWCGYQIHPLAQTIFHKSCTSLKNWFYSIFLMSQSRNGVSAKEIERHLGVTYKTAWRIQKQIRKLMARDKSMMTGTFEMDETYVGGKHHGKRGRGAEGKTAVVGIAQRKGEIVAEVVDDVKSSTVMPLVRENVAIGSRLMTDEFAIYNRLGKEGYKHGVINHRQKQYVKGDIHTNTIDGFWSQLKRSIDGTYHHVSPKYLQHYVDEFSYRYARRSSPDHLFKHLLSEVVGRPC